ncbi:L-alanine exporter AlaE [Candidatus Woesearchaeota archaeon]|nr:L-alanine exporter AlaE [Candidatus Woesearchaeota archaeon]
MQDREKIVNTETKKGRLHRWLTKTPGQRKIKSWLVDSVAINLFYTPTLAFNELVIAGMGSYETLKARSISIPLGFLLGRPFGRFREFYAKHIFKADENSSKTRKFLVDTTASLVFNAPVYASILTVSGASLREIAIGLPSYAILNTVLARPYGWFLDQFRKPFGIKPTLDKIYHHNK